jgi:hypothetical protein
MSFATPELIQTVFGPSLTKYTSSLICKICEDYNLDFDELSEKYMGTPEALSFFTTSKLHEVEKESKPRVKRQPKGEKAPKEARKPCVGQTSKGDPCKFAAMPDSELCGIHQRKSEGVKPDKKEKPEVEKKTKKSAKAKKVDSVHTHKPDVDGTDCELCESHGNIIEPGLTEKTFDATVEDGSDIRAKLQAILEAEAEDEDSIEAPVEVAPVEVAPVEVAPVETPVVDPSKKKYIRPAIRGKKAKINLAEAAAAARKSYEESVKSEAGPSEPEKVDEPADIRSKLKAIMAATHTDSESEDEDFGEETQSRLVAKLSEKFDSDSEDDGNLEQMCDSPTSQRILREAWADIEGEEEF